MTVSTTESGPRAVETTVDTLTPERFRLAAQAIEDEVGKVIVGQRRAGAAGADHAARRAGTRCSKACPGLGKTALVRTLAEVLDCTFSRIQFTPDLMPADIIGTNILVEDEQGRRQFQFQRGPIFANLVLADEINRATPKTQSALLEAMQEGTVSVAGTLYRLTAPFFVLATQNPIEMEGTYPLPEAQLDRFLFKLNVAFPSAADLMTIAERTTGGAPAPAAPGGRAAPTLCRCRRWPARRPIAEHVTALRRARAARDPPRDARRRPPLVAQVRALWRQPARPAGDDPGRQDHGPARRALQRGL